MTNYIMHDFKTEKLEEWLKAHSIICQLPTADFSYSPRRGNLFSIKGGQMVESLASSGYLFEKIFTEILPQNVQSKLAVECFEKLKNSVHNKTGKKGQKGYFETNREFTKLVPIKYSRTPLAPRLTARGNSFHGMNKTLLIEILKEVTSLIPNALVIEIDMSACHSRVAASLLPEGSMIEEALSSSIFWKTQVDQFLPLYQENNVGMDKKSLKKVLKVSLYTSLNGGNPASRDRLIDNLMSNAKDFLPKDNLTSSDIYLITKYINEKFKLINEVKDLNKFCFMKGSKFSFTYTIDRMNPYRNEASYKGISRVLQGFEVVLLCCLTQYVIELKGIPLSLDHDGLTALFILEPLVDSNKEKIEEYVLEISSSLTENMKSWSKYLLRGVVPIETKRYWFNGEVKSY